MIVEKIRSSTKYHQFSEKFYHALTIMILVLMTGTILVMDRIMPAALTQADTWNQYEQASDWLDQKQGKDPDRTVMINNPPAYYAVTGEKAIVVPFGTTRTIFQAAEKYQASYLFLDENYRTWFPSLFLQEKEPEANFHYLGEVNGLQVFQLEVKN